MKFAEVIVDVPAKETNRPFDYAIPKELEKVISVGSRVGLNFGNRVIQGFVVAVKDDSNVPLQKVKTIREVLDPYPVLTPALIQLAHWMSHKYLCSVLACIQVMLPGALKAKYERHFCCTAEKDPPNVIDPAEKELYQYVLQKGEVTWDDLQERFASAPALISSLMRNGWLEERRRIKDRLRVKTQLMVFPPQPLNKLDEALKQCSPQAKRQKELLEYFRKSPSPILLAELLAKLDMGAGTVKGAVEKGWLQLKEIEISRDPYAKRQFERSRPLELTEEQKQVYEKIITAVKEEKAHNYLLHGVTGSGKTEVYLQSIAFCLERGKEAIVLVPEISLTPQMVDRFKRRFGDKVAVLHSRLSQGERYDEWRKIRHKKAQVVVGARSAVFAPLERLGLIIIDEEHESSYKQEETPKYHARDAAMERARIQNAVVVLGSATPSLETYYAGIRKQVQIERLQLPHRVGGRPLPETHIVDMRQELRNGNRTMFSRLLHQAITDRLNKGEQMVLMLNRRGFSTFVMCRSCGYVAQCPHCEISLTYHRNTRHVRCHYCGYTEREPIACPNCQSQHIRFFGTGTQRVEEELVRWFPGIRVIRMDVDTTAEKGSHEKWLNKFSRKQADVLLGTQMIAKGLDFPNVTLVGVIAADTVLNLPDFRGAERTFQLLTQVAGRAGRHELPGEVIIQTYAPEHYSIDLASRHQFEPFALKELRLRKLRGYPPFRRLVLFTVSHEQAVTALNFAERLGQVLTERLRQSLSHFEVLGPVASPIPKLKDRYRFQCMVKYREEDIGISNALHSAIHEMEDEAKTRKVQVSADVDPYILI